MKTIKAMGTIHKIMDTNTKFSITLATKSPLAAKIISHITIPIIPAKVRKKLSCAEETAASWLGAFFTARKSLSETKTLSAIKLGMTMTHLAFSSHRYSYR